MSTKQLLAFKCEFEGRKRSETALLTGYKENTLNIYFAQKGRWFKEYRTWAKVFEQDVRNEMEYQIQAAALRAFQAIVQSLNSPNPRIVLRSAKDILDRAGYRASL